MPAGMRHIIYHCGTSRKDVYRALWGSLKVSLKVIYFLSFFAWPVYLECVREKRREREGGRMREREGEREGERWRKREGGRDRDHD